MNIKPFTLPSSESWSYATSCSPEPINQKTMDSFFSPHIAEDAGLQLCFDAEWPLLDHDPTNEDSGTCDLDLAPIESICNLESIQWNAKTIGIEPEAGEAGSHSFDIITKGLIEEMMEDYRYNLIGQEMEVFNGLLANNITQFSVQGAMFDEELPSAGFNGVADDLGLIDWDRYMDLPSGPDMSTWQDSTTEGISAQSEQIYAQLFVVNRQDNVGFTPQEVHAENAHETSSHSSTNLATAPAALIPNIAPIDIPSTCPPEKTRTTYRCYECHIRKKPCDGKPGVRCSTCEKTCKKKSKRPSVKSIMHNGTPIPQFLRTQIDKTYDLLNKLRQHVNSEHPPKGVPMINDLFRGKWSLLCHLDDECGHFSRMKYSKSAKTIVVRPAIGVPPSARHSSSNSPPFLDYQEMSQFAFERAPENLIQQLPDVDQEVATDAWKCAFFINALPTIDGYLFSDAFHFKPLEGAGDILYALIHPESHKTDGESISAKAVQSLDPPHSGKSSRACYGKVSLASSTMTLVDGKTKGTDEAVEQPVRKRMASSTDELSGRSTKL
ncbi:hypothetical protein CCHR01_12280 [Colletotrichum chrysophilum]|uniref:Uncharacterized protein n=1 Tax=Colletotrichum chrysophilum TaxID=1836956 RepID=A0AAD9ADR8_9PEZI|nr:hypothetical protein CCHR01_12280 [Colletotrichum chrysophilum]